MDDRSEASDQRFKPSNAVVISELNKDVREQCFDLILANNVKLQYSDDKFVENIRLLAPTTEEVIGSEKKMVIEEAEISITAPVVTKRCNSSN